MSSCPKLRIEGFTGAWEQRKLGDIANKVSTKNSGIQYIETVRPDPDRTLASDFVLDFRTKGLFSAIWYFLRSAFRRFVIHNLSIYE